jgi:hypothetical protein
MDDDEQATALDKLLGTSPHFAAFTNFGIFCPACSDPFKNSFVPSNNCELASNSILRSLTVADQFPPWGEAMRLAGLTNLPKEEQDRLVEEHKINFMHAQERWRKANPPNAAME